MREMFTPTIKTFGRVFNIFTTLGRHPKLLKRWMVFANHCLLKSSLPPRDRELVILRAGWVSQSAYEWAQHNRIGLEAGLSQEEIERVKEGASAAGWSDSEHALLAAVDELLVDAIRENPLLPIGKTARGRFVELTGEKPGNPAA